MDDLASIVAEAEGQVQSAADLTALDGLRVQYLGKKGVLTARLKQLGSLPPEERPVAGQAINQAKQTLQQAIEGRKAQLQADELETRLERERIDVTLPGRGQDTGGLHPVTRTLERIETIFSQAGFDIAEGPEIEDDYHNFEGLLRHRPHRPLQLLRRYLPGLFLRPRPAERGTAAALSHGLGADRIQHRHPEAGDELP